LTREDASGAINFCAPEPVRNETLAKTLGQVLSAPAIMPAPSFVIRKALGEFGDALLSSQRAIPARLQALGFDFRHPHLRAALEEIVSRSDGE
jgi:NAD dependent epimerase/dehydratase family enzyme